MRGSIRSHDALLVSLRAYEWDRAVVATLRHSTLPWNDAFATEVPVAARPLSEEQQLGARDRLSLLAQFAAHQALLRFAGIADGEVDPGEWAVLARRGCDSRLIRLAARHQDASCAPPALTLAQQFGELLGVPRLSVMRQSWARPEAVFIEAYQRLRGDAAADLQWVRRSAAGWVLAPGPDSLRTLAIQRTGWTYSDPATLEAIDAYAALGQLPTVIRLRGSGILRYSALEGLRSIVQIDGASEAAIAERLLDHASAHPAIICVGALSSFDEASRRVLQIAAAGDGITWIMPGSAPTVPETRWFVVAPRLSVARELDERLAAVSNRATIINAFVSGNAFDDYLLRETIDIPDDGGVAVGEPSRSYIAALALLGRAIPRVLASQFLREFLSDRELDELAIDGVATVTDTEYRFVSSAVRDHFMKLVPVDSRSAMCLVAANVCAEAGEFKRAAALLIRSGDESTKPLELLERVPWKNDCEMMRTLSHVPLRLLSRSQRLAADLTRALTDAARYHDARDAAAMLEEPARDLALAIVDRRTGDYAPALARLERLPRSCQSDLLRAEIMYVLRRGDDAVDILRSVEPASDDERVRVGYARALAGIDTDEQWLQIDSRLCRYLAARLATYRAVEADDLDEALRKVSDAIDAASAATERIDALLDGVYVRFAAGSWTEARQSALEALAEVEETQGDRAAGGLLFLLAYLYADDAQWAQAAQRITRLHHFYGETSDAQHLAELDLLGAYLHFSRGEFDSAVRMARGLLDRSNDVPIRAAAQLIVAECDWVAGREMVLPDCVSASIEFSDRRALLERRLDSAAASPIAGAFTRALAEWERDGGAPPAARTRGEKLKLFRAALGQARRKRDSSLITLAAATASEVGITFDAPRSAADDELRFLRAAALREFPFAPHDFDVPWRFATRNRLGHWNEIGSAEATATADLDVIALSPEGDWIGCSERELLFIRGSASWPRDSRDAVAAIFRRRAELHRLARLLDQEQASEKSSRAPAAAGVVGESSAIRDVLSRVTLIARRDVPICILGESGTGKELIARAVHVASPRRHKPFTAINCAALPETLVESELFGHARGAFTGADRDRAGVIEVSEGGTLFLDEIGEMPLATQAKLLRFLQEGEFRRVGDTVNRSADVRIVTATNRKLETAVESGRFREDLYYRIRGVEVVLPPLRDRGADILLIANHFLTREREKHRSGPQRLSSDVESIFLAYSWPGNVRELQNTIRGAHAMAGEARELDVEHLPERLRVVAVGSSVAGSYQDAVARFRRELIERALLQTNGNQNRAAAMLRISRQALGYQIRELGILTEKQDRSRVLVTER